MMSRKLQIFLLIGIALVLLYIINMVRKKRLDLRYALGWILIGLVIVVLTIFPRSLNRIAFFLGITSPVNMLFFFGFCLVVGVIFSLTVALSHMSDKVKKMAQEIAIMRKDMYDQLNEQRKSRE